jgi:hypothetical protein
VKISQEKVSLNFKERLNDGNLWLLPFSLFKGFVASTENLSFNLIIFKMFWSAFGEVFKSEKTQACVALALNLMRNKRFCIMVRYCNIVTPILKSKISLLRLIAEELWNIRENFSIFIIKYRRFASNVNRCIIRLKEHIRR